MIGARPAPALPAVPTPDARWLVVEEGFDLAREHEIESLFTVANGYVGTRGSLAEGSLLSSPATLVAGLFDVPPGPHALPELAVAPDWTRLRCFVAGRELRLEAGETLEHRRVLDLRQGILWREWRHRDPVGRVSRVRGLRLASLADRHALIQCVTLTSESFHGEVLLEALTDASVRAEGTNSSPGLEPISERNAPLPATAGRSDPLISTLSLRTAGTGLCMALASAAELQAAAPGEVHREVEAGPNRIVERWTLSVASGETYRLDRLVSIHTSRDAEQPTASATEHLERLLAQGIDGVVAAHVLAWERRWHTADVEIEGDEIAQRALRFACYHLISANNPGDERISIGARALTGRAYLGHVFWDVEIFMLPFYILTDPPSARTLLMYRYHTLAAAKAKARELGYRGALYAWESADTGRDVTPRFATAPGGEVIEILNGEQEIHISAAIAYAVYQYWHATADEGFLLDAGAEILLETTRFWASRGQVEKDGCYHIRHVIGPDEYHSDVDDNAYTNLMAQWNLEHGAKMAQLLRERWPECWNRLAARLGIDDDEVASWSALAAAMYTGFHPETGLYEQFQGYFDLEEIDLDALEPRTTAVDVLLGRERIQGSKILRQADVVMAVYLLWDRLSPAVREANFRYYEPRTGHGSSLSPGIHALVAARLGDEELAAKYFRQAAEIDLANNMGNAAGGVHAAALGALWQATVFGYAGLRLETTGPSLDPRLPVGWNSLRFSVAWRGQWVRVSLGGEPRGGRTVGDPGKR